MPYCFQFTPTMTSELTKALCAFHRDVNTIHKTATAQYGRFADLATVLTAVTPALAKNGLCLTHTFEPNPDGETFLVTTVHHISGDSFTSKLEMVIGKGRNALHDFGGSVTYLRRYSLLAILGLAADVDTDGELGEAPAKPAPKAEPAPKAKPAPAPAPAPAPSQAAPPSDPPVNPDKLDELFQTVISHPNRDAVLNDFRKAFDLDPSAKVKPFVTSQVHFDKLFELCLKHE